MDNTNKMNFEKTTAQFPFGLPTGLNVEELINQSMKVTNFIDFSRKIAKITPKGEASYHLNDYVKNFSTGKEKFTPKRLSAATALCIPAAREELFERAETSNLTKHSAEGVMLNAYLSAKGFPSFDCLSDCAEIEALPSYLHDGGLEAVYTSLLKFRIDDCLGEQFKNLHKIVSMVMADFDEPELEKFAAWAWFALASIASRRELLDAVHFKNRPVFDKYYSHLVFHADPLGVVVKQIEYEYENPYLPIFSTIEGKGHHFIFKVYAQIQMLKSELDVDDFRAIERLTDTDKSEFLREQITKAIVGLEDVNLDITNSFCEMVKDKLCELIDFISELTDGNSQSLPGLLTQNDFDEAKCAIDLLIKSISTENSGEIEDLRKSFIELTEEIQHESSRHIEKIGQLSSDLTNLVNDSPVSNRVKIKSLCDDIEQAESDFIEFQSIYRNELTAAIGTIINYEIPSVTINQCEHRPNEIEITELLSTIENLEDRERKLCAENTSLRAAINSEKESTLLTTQTESILGIREDVRAIMQKITRSINSCSIPELLDAITVLYPDRVVVLKSAKKAAEESLYTNKQALWTQLNALVVDYLDSNLAGNPDSKSRKVFPVKMFAANESKTTSNSKLRKERVEMYQGKEIYFEKHLRLGVAQNIRESIRVHFEIIDGKVIIAHCGNHMNLSN